MRKSPSSVSVPSCWVMIALPHSSGYLERYLERLIFDLSDRGGMLLSPLVEYAKLNPENDRASEFYLP